jgi:hypothetical protein
MSSHARSRNRGRPLWQVFTEILQSGLLGVGLGPSQVILSWMPVALAAGLSAGLLLVTGKPTNHQMTIEVSKDD